MKKISVLIVLLLGATLLYAQNAADIVHSSRNRIQSNTISSRSRMVITEKNGSTSERIIDQYSKDDAKGNGRTVIVFQSPNNVKGTRFLTMDTASGKSDQWIFLPELSKSRRIAASEGSGSFMGTDFSYDDISFVDRDSSLDSHKLLREETFNGNVCHVIESTPIPEKNSSFPYSKTILWIDKEKLLNYKVELYNRRGELVKIMEMSNFEDVQGRLTPKQTKVSTAGKGTSTTIFMDKMKYDDPIPETVFSVKFLETGKP